MEESIPQGVFLFGVNMFKRGDGNRGKGHLESFKMVLTPLFVAGVLAMTFVVALSNYLVSIPLNDWLTWGAFSYPVSYLVADIINKRCGVKQARYVVYCGFFTAVVLSAILVIPRIACASGIAFLVSQILNVFVFDRLRNRVWWLPPVLSSLISGAIDTVIFFSLAFSNALVFIGGHSDYAVTAIFEIYTMDVPRWVGWALGDCAVKVGMSVIVLVLFRAATRSDSSHSL
jgi:uncharacterized PurR-regulated membrane protein YhhQ (DUF165 family)